MSTSPHNDEQPSTPSLPAKPVYAINGLDLLVNRLKESRERKKVSLAKQTSANATVPLEPSSSEEDDLELFKEQMIHDIIQFQPDNCSTTVGVGDFRQHILRLLWKDWLDRHPDNSV